MKTNEVERYTQMGMAALLPGMMHMITLMQAQLDEFRSELNGRQNAPKRGRPPKDISLAKSEGAKGGWSADPEERKAEMARRIARRAELSRQRRKAGKKAMGPEQRTSRAKTAAAARWGKKAKPMVQMEKAS